MLVKDIVPCPAELNSWSHLPTGCAILDFFEEESLMSRIGDLFKGSQVFRNQQLGHFFLHYSPLTHALLKTEYGSNSLPRLLNLSVDTCWRLWECVSCVSEGDLSFFTVSRRHGSDWEPLTPGGKSFRGGWWGLQNPWLEWHWPIHRMSQQSVNLLLVGRRNMERDMGVLPLCLPTWVCKMQWQRYS